MALYGKKTKKPLDWDVLTEITRRPKKGLDNVDFSSTAVIHLRLGDVLDNRPQSVSAFLAGETTDTGTEVLDQADGSDGTQSRTEA